MSILSSTALLEGSGVSYHRFEELCKSVQKITEALSLGGEEHEALQSAIVSIGPELKDFDGPASILIPVAQYRRHLGPEARNAGKNGRKMDFGPTGKKGGKMAPKWELAPKMAIFPCLGHFSPFSGGAKSIFGHLFPISGLWGLYMGTGIAMLHTGTYNL